MLKMHRQLKFRSIRCLMIAFSRMWNGKRKKWSQNRMIICRCLGIKTTSMKLCGRKK